MGDGAHAKEVLIILIDMREDKAAFPHFLILREQLKWHVMFARIFLDFDCAACCAIVYNNVRHVNGYVHLWWAVCDAQLFFGRGARVNNGEGEAHVLELEHTNHADWVRVCVCVYVRADDQSCRSV